MENPLAADLEHVLAHTGGIWRELAGARIFVTGGTGFFGCWLLESFAWAHDRLHLANSLTVMTRSPDAFHAKAPHLAAHPAIKVVFGDLRDFSPPEDRFTHVIHAATDANARMIHDSPIHMMETIIEGTRRVLDFTARAGARRFLLTSSGAVYGGQPPSMTHVPETYGGGPDTTDARWSYGEAKRVAELLCAVFFRDHGIEPVIARGFAFVGPYLPLDLHYAIGNFIRDGLQNKPIRMAGDGTPVRSYLYAADLAIWLWTILVHGRPCRPYNVGSERDVTIAELAQIVAETLDSPRGSRAVRPPGARYVPSTRRARTELRLKEHIPLEEGIRRTAAFHS